MRKAKPGAEIDCFTIGLNAAGAADDQVEDLPFARLVAKHLGVNLHEVSVDPEQIRALPQMIAMLDEPMTPPHQCSAYGKQGKRMGILCSCPVLVVTMFSLVIGAILR